VAGLMNPKTKYSPLVADHIDGNWRNNVENIVITL
jgi:hypothetical protein